MRKLLKLALALIVSCPLIGYAQTVTYYHTDALGTPIAITDSTGTLVSKRDYEPYGKQLTPAIQDGPGFTGHVADSSTGLVYMQQRYCDPMIGRCLSVDPVTAYDGGDMRYFNRYAYAFNSPYSFKDPDGRCPSCDRFGDSYRDMSPSERDGLAKIAGAIGLAVATEVATTKGLGLIAKGVAAFRAIRAAKGGARTITRYMGEGEAAVAKRTGEIPNVGRDGVARPTHVTADKPLDSGSQAMTKYELPEAPTHSATVPANRVDDLGKAPDGRWTTSGNGGQNATNQAIQVKPDEIKRLDP